jgi:KUP system potassium uptake protein
MAGEPGTTDLSEKRRLAALSLAALGVVYGDIGTSPLYAVRECFFGDYAVPPTPANILGVLSLIFWAIVFVISIKYLTFIMQADNRGEGGIMALTALLRAQRGSGREGRFALIALGLFGASLLYGDGMITPAISVLSAVEGLQVATVFFQPYVIPIAIAILVGLFLVQHHGTGRVGAIFGPVTLSWFVVLAALGIRGIVGAPHVLAALNPVHGVAFFARNGGHGFLVLGAVFLVATGGEALYADMGHFGKRPIRLAWFAVVLPGLLLNYFGQGALLLTEPQAAHNPFYRLAPSWALYPMVLLATAATIIASQAIISGCFSLTRQAIQLGYLSRLPIHYTSSEEIGQVYMPSVNRILMLATIGLVIAFRTSSNLAAAYGVAVVTTMVITTMLFYVVARDIWQWSRWAAGVPAVAFLVVDLGFFAANMAKVEHGGWFPLLIAAVIFALLSTWRRGRRILGQKLRAGTLPIERFLDELTTTPATRVPGTAVFLTGDPEGVPVALLHNLKHNHVLHERVVLLTIVTEEIPHVTAGYRVQFEPLRNGFYRVIGHYGFMEQPNIPSLLRLVKMNGVGFDVMKTTFFLGRETLIASRQPTMARWRKNLFAFMARNAQRATAYFRIPPNRVIEIGVQIEL